MASRLASLPVSQSLTPHPWLNRRVAVRYRCGPLTTGRLAVGGCLFRRARIQDISRGGVALVTRRPIPAGCCILIQLKNEILDITYDLSARVAHTTRKKQHHWVIGCAFTRELTAAELDTLL